MSRVPNSRRAAGAMIRSVEGMHQSDATSKSPDATPKTAESAPTATTPLTGTTPPTGRTPATPAVRGEVGLRYDSLVVYPSATPAPDERNSATPAAVETCTVQADKKAEPDEVDHDNRHRAEISPDDDLTRNDGKPRDDELT